MHAFSPALTSRRAYTHTRVAGRGATAEPAARNLSPVWRPVRFVIAAALGPLAGTGCEQGPGAAAEMFFTRDSAGVVIAENAPGAVEAAPMLAREMILDIGVVEGDTAYQLFRVSGALRLADGGIAVMNSGTSELRIFGPDGAHRKTVGRRGEGPEEFQQPVGLWSLPGDSLATFDEDLGRVTVFTPDGDFARVVLIQGQALNPGIVTFFDDGSFVTSDLFLDIADQGFAPMYNHLVRWTAAGAYLDSLGRHVYAEMGRVGSPTNMMIAGRMFAAYTTMTGNLDTYWVGRGEEADVPRFGPNGTMSRRVRWTTGDRAVSPTEIENFRRERLEGVQPERRAEVESMWRDQPAMEVFPAYQRIFATRDSRLWVAEYQRPGEAMSRWLIFDPDGRIIGRMETGRRFSPLDGSADWILARETDEFDVEHVRLFRLSESSAQ